MATFALSNCTGQFSPHRWTVTWTVRVTKQYSFQQVRIFRENLNKRLGRRRARRTLTIGDPGQNNEQDDEEKKYKCSIQHIIEHSYKTAPTTRSTLKKSTKRLLSHTILDQLLSRKRRTHSRTRSTSTSTFEFTFSIMTDTSILARARKARFDDLISFSGQPSEDVERFLKSIKNTSNAHPMDSLTLF